MKKLVAGICLTAASLSSWAIPINTSDLTVYAAFAAGATIEDFEGVSGMTPLSLSDYINASDSSVVVPADAQLSDDIAGLFFHSGGASFNDPAGTPGTPAALISLSAGIASDAQSATNVIGSLEINSEFLDIDNFIEIIFLGGNVNRAGVWLNPSRGNALLTAFDSTGSALESVQGTAGNFVGIQRASNEIRFVSLVSLSSAGFTADDLTFGQSGVSTVPEPASLLLVVVAMAMVGWRRRLPDLR